VNESLGLEEALAEDGSDHLLLDVLKLIPDSFTSGKRKCIH
jgi:hypothetical protein